MEFNSAFKGLNSFYIQRHGAVCNKSAGHGLPMPRIYDHKIHAVKETRYLLALQKCYLILSMVDLTYSVVSYLRRLIFIFII